MAEIREMTIRMFLAEDDVHWRDHIQDRLAQQSELELIATKPTQAAATAWLDEHADEWDLAIVDLFLDEGTGAGIVRHCRRHGITKPIVVFTNYEVPGVLNSVREFGASAVFSKLGDGLESLIDYCVTIEIE